MPVSKRAVERMEPYWQSKCGRATVYVGDCREVLPQLEPSQFHAVVTDPPYNLGFMSKRWDGTGVAFDQATWDAVMRVTKPGAHLLSFGGTRTWHRMTCAIEDAGFEVRDTIMWVYGSGMPKSMDVSKAIDKMLGAERKVVDSRKLTGKARVLKGGNFNGTYEGKTITEQLDITAPTTDAAKQWDGWGTGLKPSYEPIVLARKPMLGTVAQCVLENSTGGINVDACRVGIEGGCKRDDSVPHTLGVCGNSLSGSVDGSLNGERSPRVEGLGRWPANLIHDGSPEVLASLPKGASRYFYSAKADADDRAFTDVGVHPTTKPLDLMRYLVRLVCVKGGTILDPFMGSGSTGCASIAEGMYFVGVEQSEEYAKIAVDRLKEVLGEHELVERLQSGVRATKGTSLPPAALD